MTEIKITMTYAVLMERPSYARDFLYELSFSSKAWRIVYPLFAIVFEANSVGKFFSDDK